MIRPAPERAAGLIAAFVRHRNAANLLMALLLLFGLWGASQLNRQLMPTVETGTVTVSATWSGASAEDVERGLLALIEPAVRYIDGVTAMSGNAREGGGTITLSFSRGADMVEARNAVESALQGLTSLPAGAEAPTVAAPRFYDPVASIGISGPFPENTLRHYAREIRDGLLARGLDRVTFTGYRDREIVATVSEASLRQLDLTLSDIAAAITPNIGDRPSGSLSGDFDAQIRAVAADVGAASVAATEVRSLPSGEAVTLGDIAVVEDRFSDARPLGYMRGEPAIRITVSRSANADSIDSYNAVRDYVAEIAPTLPPSLNIAVFDAAAEQIDQRLVMLLWNGLGGLALVLLVLFLFLDGRVAFWVAAGIPIAIVAALGIMFLTGQTLDMISMFAIMMMLGIIVDDAIIVGEHTATRFAMGDSAHEAAIAGAGRMFAPVMACVLTTMAAFAPILLVGDAVGQIMRALPMVALAVLFASVVECFLILPGHMGHSLPRERRRPGRFRRGFDRGFAVFRDRLFGGLADLSYRWRYATLAVALGIAMLGAGLLLSGKLGFTFFPTAEGESFNIFASFQPGTPESEMEGIIVAIEDAVSAVEAELTPHGEQLVLTTYANLDTEEGGASFNVYLTPSEQRSVRTADLIQAIRDALPTVAGVERIGVFERRGGPPGRAIDIQFSGADAPTLKRASEELQNVLEGFDGVVSVSDTLPYGSPELIMALTPRGAALGFTLETLGAQIREAFEGRSVATVVAQEEEIAIRLVREIAAEGSSALRELWVQAPGGAYVPLETAVSFSERQGFGRIAREEGRSTVSVRADVEEGVTTGDEVLARLTADYLPAIAARHGVDYDLGGTRAERNAAFADLGLGFLMALGVMYIIVAWIFASYLVPLAVMLVIPFGAVGALWGHYLLGYDLTIVSVMGMLGLAGIVINNSIILVSRLQERQAGGEGLRTAATGAARDRLRAVLLTSLTTIGGLLPLLFERSLQAQFLIPMAVTIVFGVALATVLVLFLVPAVIAIGADIGAAARWAFLTRNAPTLRELLAGRHHEAPPPAPAE